jgi:hypothetical protein
MEYLGYIMSVVKISVSTKKVDAVADWQVPTTQKEVRSLLIHVHTESHEGG